MLGANILAALNLQVDCTAACWLFVSAFNLLTDTFYGWHSSSRHFKGLPVNDACQ